MKVSAILGAAVAVTMAQPASASFWGKVKNVFNDCKYSSEERRAVIDIERMSTAKLPDNLPASAPAFSTEDFYTKAWLRDFRYVIVVDRAAKGGTAQTMRVYEFGNLIINTKVSTGREGFELRRKNPACTGAPPKSYWSQTPTGYYSPKFLSRDHTSSSWDSYMPFAVFYDIENGLALHEVYPKYSKYLGGRASGGCTRLPKGVAEDLFDRVERTAGATVPRINVDGTPALDSKGQVIYESKQVHIDSRNQKVRTFNTYSALIIVQDSSK